MVARSHSLCWTRRCALPHHEKAEHAHDARKNNERWVFFDAARQEAGNDKDGQKPETEDGKPTLVPDCALGKDSGQPGAHRATSEAFA
jgi:hypothetical protein